MRLYKFLSATLAVCLTLVSPCRGADSVADSVSSEHVSGNSASDKLGDPGVVLRRLADGSTVIESGSGTPSPLRSNDLYFPSDSRVIKLGPVYAKDKSIEELSAMLFGPIDSKLEVTLIQGDQYLTKTLTRYSPATMYKTASIYGPLLNVTDLFTNSGYAADDLAALGERHHASGNNLAAVPYFIAATNCPNFMFPALFSDPIKALPKALDFYALTGMFEQFDAAAKQALEFSEAHSAKCSDAGTKALTQCAAMLAQHGCSESAQKIYNTLYKLLPTLSIQNRITVLLGRASLAGPNEDAAQRDYKQVADYCAQPGNLQREFLLASLKSLVDYAVDSKHREIAEAAQRHIVDLQLDAQGSVRIFQYQKLISALLKLSDIYEQFDDSTKSQSALLQAASIYTDKLNAQERMQLERWGSPCLSDVEIRLANSYARAKQLPQALMQVDLAKNLISEALGKDCRAVLQLEKLSALLVRNDASNQEQLFKEFDNLLAIAEMNRPKTEVVEGSADARLARLVYDSAVTNQGKAITSLDALFEQELAKSTHSADDITRLINLVKLLKTQLTTTRALAMLRRMDSYLASPGTTFSANRLYQTAEIALMGKDDSDASPAWSNLTTLLNDLEVAQFNSRERDSNEDQQKRFQQMITVSYIYAFLGEPVKAHRLFNYATRSYPAATKRDVSPIAYEAILYLLQNNITEAQKKIDILMVPDRSRNDYSRMLGALSVALFRTSHIDLSLSVLRTESAESSNVDKILAYRRALILYRLGRFKESLSQFSDGDDSVSLPGHEVLNVRFLRAEVLAKTGNTYKAILAFLRVSGGSAAQALAFARAVELANTLPTISPDTIRALVEAAQRQHTSVATRYGAVSVQTIINLAEKNDFRSAGLDTLKNWLQSVELATGNVDQALLGAKQHAQNSENALNPAASSEWANVARIHLGKQQYADGVAAMLRALSMESGESFNHSMYHPGNMRADLGFTLLVKAKKYREAEAILKQSILTHRASGTYASAFIEKAFLAELFIDEDNYSEAKKWAEALLATFSQYPSICLSRGNSMSAFLFYSVVDKFTEQKQFDIAENLLEQATKIQLTEVGPRNALFIENFQSYAKLREAQSKLILAEGFARKALDLENWIGGSRNSGRISSVLLASILRKEGKSAEADRVSVKPAEGTRRPPDLQKLYNIRFYTSHSASPELYAITAEEPLKQILSETIETHGAGSVDALKAYDALTKFYVQQRRYDEAEQIQLRELEILNEQYGKCSVPKFTCMINFAEIYLLQNKLAKAALCTDQITKAPTGEVISETKDKLRLANVLLSMGKREEALEWAKQVAKPLHDYPGAFGYSSTTMQEQYREFMRRAGAEDQIMPLTKPPSLGRPDNL